MALSTSTGLDGNGVRVVHDTIDLQKYPGIDTFEGRAHPLILGETMLAQSLVMPGGLTVPDHPETEESMVYTLRGMWVLRVDGENHLMSPGSLHWIREGAVAGCEVPFDEPAVVLSFARVRGAGEKLSSAANGTRDIKILVRNGSVQ